MRVAIILLVAPLAVATAPLSAAADLIPVFAGTGVPSRAEDHGPAAARTVQAMIEYTRWPTRTAPMALCVTGPALHAARLDGLRLSDGRTVERRDVAAAGIAAQGCDVVYMGQIALPAMRQVTAAVRGRGVLTIAEADPQCRSQAMFCLAFAPRAVSFRLNIDAVSRSGLRVDPRVLRMAQGGL